MKKQKFVITSTPTKLPVVSTILFTFLLYYFNVPMIVWGIYITLAIIYWVVVLIIIKDETYIDINKDWKEFANPEHRAFLNFTNKRLLDIIKQRLENDGNK